MKHNALSLTTAQKNVRSTQSVKVIDAQSEIRRDTEKGVLSLLIASTRPVCTKWCESHLRSHHFICLVLMTAPGSAGVFWVFPLGFKPRFIPRNEHATRRFEALGRSCVAYPRTNNLDLWLEELLRSVAIPVYTSCRIPRRLSEGNVMRTEPSQDQE